MSGWLQWLRITLRCRLLGRHEFQRRVMPICKNLHDGKWYAFKNYLCLGCGYGLAETIEVQPPPEEGK